MRAFEDALKTAIAAGLCLMASPAVADLECVLQVRGCVIDCVETTVNFTIDTSQFVAPQSPRDPPRRQVATVTLNDATFVAQAIIMQGGVVGFHEDAGALGSRLMIVQPDGTARLTLQPSNQRLEGQCTTE